LCAAVLTLGPARPAQAAKSVEEATPVNVPIPKGAQHIVIKKGDKEVREIFTYFPYPPPPTMSRVLPLTRVGLYRVEVDPGGRIAAVTILRSMGKSMDYNVLKTFTRWKAKPGPLRVVDVPWTFHYKPAGIRAYH
jgi:TonB family protein